MKTLTLALSISALGFAALGATGASAAVADFETKVPFGCDFTTVTDSGLNFAHDFAACFYGPTDNADFPTPNTSVVMAIGFSDISITTVGGTPFDLTSVDLAFGPFNHAGLNADTTTVTGFYAMGGTVSTVLTIGYGFQTYAFGWTGLSSVTFGELAASSEYIGFDNIVYNESAIPEPATWALLISGFGLTGFALRRRNMVATA